MRTSVLIPLPLDFFLSSAYGEFWQEVRGRTLRSRHVGPDAFPNGPSNRSLPSSLSSSLSSWEPTLFLPFTLLAWRW